MTAEIALSSSMPASPRAYLDDGPSVRRATVAHARCGLRLEKMLRTLLHVMRGGRLIRWSWVLPAYAIGGFVSGFGFLPLIPLVRAVGLPRDASVTITSFCLLPALIIVFGLLYRRLLAGLIGVVVALLGWGVGYAVACKVGGFDSIVTGLVTIAEFLVPGLVALALLIGVWRQGARGVWVERR